MEYENIVQIVIRVIIGWNQSEQKGYKGAFGIHSHISVWIENFNFVRNLLFHENEDIRSSAYQRLQTYFEKIAQASFGELFLSQQIILTQIVLCLTKLMMCYILLMTKS